MTKREKFKRRVIELIHVLPYEEAIKKELAIKSLKELPRKKDQPSYCVRMKEYTNYKEYTITIGRVMQALPEMVGYEKINSFEKVLRIKFNNNLEFVDWKLTKENGTECTDDDQTDETIIKLLDLISINN